MGHGLIVARCGRTLSNHKSRTAVAVHAVSLLPECPKVFFPAAPHALHGTHNALEKYGSMTLPRYTSVAGIISKPSIHFSNRLICARTRRVVRVFFRAGMDRRGRVRSS